MILMISILVLDRLNGVESDVFCLLVSGVFEVLVVLLFCYAISSALTCCLRVPHRGVFPLENLDLEEFHIFVFIRHITYGDGQFKSTYLNDFAVRRVLKMI